MMIYLIKEKQKMSSLTLFNSSSVAILVKKSVQAKQPTFRAECPKGK